MFRIFGFWGALKFFGFSSVQFLGLFVVVPPHLLTLEGFFSRQIACSASPPSPLWENWPPWLFFFANVVYHFPQTDTHPAGSLFLVIFPLDAFSPLIFLFAGSFRMHRQVVNLAMGYRIPAIGHPSAWRKSHWVYLITRLIDHKNWIIYRNKKVV